MIWCILAFSESSWLVFIQSSFDSSLQESCEYFVAMWQEAYRPIRSGFCPFSPQLVLRFSERQMCFNSILKGLTNFSHTPRSDLSGFCFWISLRVINSFVYFYSCSDHSVVATNIHFRCDFTVSHNLPIWRQYEVNLAFVHTPWGFHVQYVCYLLEEIISYYQIAFFSKIQYSFASLVSVACAKGSYAFHVVIYISYSNFDIEVIH